MTPEPFDFVIPLYCLRWNTQAVMEGLTQHYQPRSIHIVTLPQEVQRLQTLSQGWNTAPLHIHNEETLFVETIGLTKEQICAELDLGESLYTPGWFYQQLIKLGAFEGIQGLSEWYVVWDSDLLPVKTWPLLDGQGRHRFALLQHNRWGNPAIVSKWETWISSILNVEAITDPVGTFIPHHLWFKQEHLQSFAQKVGEYFQSEEHWLKLMMRSANVFGTFSEYWSYVSWVASQKPEDLAFHGYDDYGATTERFFDDGTALFSAALRRYLSEQFPDAAVSDGEEFSPTYGQVSSFIHHTYDPEALPSSLSFESSPRHLKKNEENMHIEELRSRWNPRNVSRNVKAAATP